MNCGFSGEGKRPSLNENGVSGGCFSQWNELLESESYI
jgi:hypothetical protein